MRLLVALFAISAATPRAASGGVLLKLGDVLVAEPGASRVSVIDPATGAKTIVSQEGLLGPANRTVGVALARDGDIIVLHRTTGLIRVNAATGGQNILSQGGFFRDPWALVVDKNTGFIYVADSGFDYDRSINEPGRIIKVDPVSGSQELVALGSACNFFPAGAACQNTTSPGSYLSHPYGIAIDYSGVPGTLIVADMSAFNGRGAVIRLQPVPGGAQTLLWGPPDASPPPQVAQSSPLSCPMGVTVEPNGNILLTAFTFPVPVSPTMPPPNGTYYGCSPPGVFRIDLASGQQRLLNADAPEWQPGHAYAVGNVVRDGGSPSYVHRVATAGTSQGVAPAWNGTLNASTTDGTVVWQNLGRGAQWLIPFGIDTEPTSPSGYNIIVTDEGHSAAFRLGSNGQILGTGGPFITGLSNVTHLDVIDFTPPNGFRVEPIPSGGAPFGALPAGTVQTTLSLDTNVNATCRYSLVPGVDYQSMSNMFSATGTTVHSALITALVDGHAYDFYVRCIDGAGHVNTGDYVITFEVDPPPPPSVVVHSPSAGANGVATTAVVTATFSEAVQAGTLGFELRTSNGTLVGATVTYDAARRTAVLDPIGELVAGQTYTATVANAQDLAGHNLVGPTTWTFAVAATGFSDPVLLSGLVEPTGVQFAPDGRIFAAEKSGIIRVWDHLADPTPDVFADLRTQVHDYGARGLVGLLIDPAFPTRPYVYALYTHDAAIGGVAPRWGVPQTASDPCPDAAGSGCAVSARLSRLTATGNLMTAEHVLVEDWFQQYPGQSVGDLAFGPDGALYASAGDGAHATLVDAGQLIAPSPDPPNEGGALRSQDLRTPADPVTLSGSLIRVHPDTGRPLARVPAMNVSGPTIDGNGVRSYGVVSAFQGGSSATTVRVVLPTNPALGQPPRLLYVLPVESGVSTLASPFSDGLEELRLLDIPNRFNATLIAPSFVIEPWYGDHASDLTRRLESYIVQDLVPFGDSLTPAGTSPERWLIGFSKSGHGALSLILRHPHVFSAVAAWDAPAQLTDLTLFQGLANNFGTESQFDRYEIPTLITQNAAAFQSRPRLWISGDISDWTTHMQQLDVQLTQAGVLHTYVSTGPRAHAWSSGWLDGAVTGLAAMTTSVPPIDLNEARITAFGLRQPVRFAFRPGTAEIWVGDSQPGAVHEVNRVSQATDGTVDNFGWPCFAGTAAQSGYAGTTICQGLASQSGAAEGPLLTYPEGQPLYAGDVCGAAAGPLTGVAFAGAGAYPGGYSGALFLAHQGRQCIWAVPIGTNGQPLVGASLPVLSAAASPAKLQVGPGGQLVYADQVGGTIRQLTYTTANRAPVAVIQPQSPTAGPSPLTVTLSASASSDSDSQALSYSWDLDGDGAFDDGTTALVTATFTGLGRHTVLLLVQDPLGLSHVAPVDILTGAPATTSNFVGIETQLSEGGRWDSPGAWADLRKNDGAYSTAPNALARLATPPVGSDQYAEITYSQDPGAASWVGVMTRIQSATNGSGYLAIAYAGEVRLYRADDNGSLQFTLLASASAAVGTAPRRLRLESEGNLHRVIFNGVVLIVHTANGVVYAGGQPGVAASTFGGPQVRILTFEAGSVTPSASDTLPPFRFNGQPVGVLPVGTIQAVLSLSTNEVATCRYAAQPGVSYPSMSAFTTTGGTAHAVTVASLTNGSSYDFYVRCQDGVGNTNTDDFQIVFLVAGLSGAASSFVGSENPLSEGGRWDSPGSWTDLRKSDGAYTAGLNALGRLVTPVIGADQYAEITLSTNPGSSSWVGVMTRIQGPTNGSGYLAIAYAGQVRLYRVDDGATLNFTLLASAAANLDTTPRRLRLESVGNVHRVYFNQTQLILYTADGIIYSVGQPGVAASTFGGPQVTILSFDAGEVAAATSIFAGVEGRLSEGGRWDSPGPWADLQKNDGAFATGLNALGRLVTPLMTSDQYAEIAYDQDPGTSSWVGVMTRIQGATNGSGYVAIAYAGEVRLYRADDTGSLAFTLLAAANADTGASPRRLRLESAGNVHRVVFNGAVVITHTASGPLYLNGQPGVAASTFGGPQVRILSFEAGGLVTPPIPASDFSGVENPLSEAGRWDSAGAWTDLQKNNGAFSTGLNAMARLVAPALTSDHYSEITFDQDPGSSSWVGVMTRIQGANNGSGYLAIAYAGEVRLYRADDVGSLNFTFLASAPADLSAPPRRIRLESEGNVHRVFFNGAAVITHTATGTVYTGGQPGVAASTFGGTQVRILSFRADNIVTVPPPSSTFTGVENPLSEAGRWDSPGAWSDLRKNDGAYAAGLNSLARLVTPVLDADQYVEITYDQDPGSASWVGVATRVQGATNGSGYLVIAHAGEVRLYRTEDAGSLNFTLLASAAADIGAAPRRLRLESTGNTHRVRFNGTQVINYVASGTVYTSGQPGVAASTFGGPQVGILSFEAGNLTSADLTPPFRSNGQPVGALTFGTTQTVVSVTTDESAMCRYSPIPGTAYGSMTPFTTTGALAHTSTITGLTNGSSYNFYVRCQDVAGNENEDDYGIAFSVPGSLATSSTFQGVENPLSEGGQWDSPGAWVDLQKSQGALTSTLNAMGRLVTPSMPQDQYAEITYDQDPGAGSWVGVSTRVQGAANGSGYLAIAHAGEVRLYRADDTGSLSFTLLASTSASVGTAPRRLRLESAGNTHRVYFNGTELLNHTVTGTIYSGGQPGVAASVFGGPQVKILSFEGGDLGP